MANGLGAGLKGIGFNLNVAFEKIRNEILDTMQEMAKQTNASMDKVSYTIIKVGTEAENTQGKIENLRKKKKRVIETHISF